MIRLLIRLLVLAATVLIPMTAAAHAFRPVLLDVTEEGPGTYRVTWTRGPVAGAALAADALQVRWPAGCVARDNALSCGAEGLSGLLVVDGLTASPVDVIVTVRPRDEAPQTVVLTPERPAANLGPSSPESPTSVTGFIALGVEHIALGWDHLLFVLGLVLLVSTRRALLLTVTAFTLAHSVTLVAATLRPGLLAPAPVEVAIALSIVVVALEILRRVPSSLGRHPWRAAAAFGLLHGLGFAGALSSLRVGSDAVLPALLGFNLGVELGQLAVVGALLAGLAAVPARLGPHVRVACAYLMGVLATSWVLERMLQLGVTP